MTSRQFDSLSGQVRDTFNKALRQREAAQNLNGEEWAQFRKIRNDCAAQIRGEQRLFELDYQTRFEVARKRRINEAGAKQKTFKPRWLGSDKFDSQAIARQADRDVRHAHAQVIAHLEAKRDEALDALLQRSEHRQRLRDKPKQDFAKAANRRSGRDRRKGPAR